MKETESSSMEDAGQRAWTRHLARDLFPGTTMPFAWTLLRTPADVALRNTYSELGAPLVTGASPLWRLEGGYVYLNVAAVAETDQGLGGAAWLGVSQPNGPSGLRARLQAGGIAKRCQARVNAAMSEATGLQTRLSRWLTWVQGLKWIQADLLQVMEELEPHALSALQNFFLVRAGLNGAHAALEARLQEFPACSPEVRASLYFGTADLPSIAMSDSIVEAAKLSPADPHRLTSLARCSHRGPGEIRPDALRWSEAPELLNHLAAQGEPRWSASTAQVRREMALTGLRHAINAGEFRQVEEMLRNLDSAVRAADIAWDTLTMVMAAAQRWSVAAARETLAAGLISRPADVLYLELEELKQVATGEWHGGYQEEVQEAVSKRMGGTAPAAAAAPQARTVMASSACEGPVYCASPKETLPPQGAIWLAETADPGCAPLWRYACEVWAVGADPWAPGVIAARGIGVPVRVDADVQET